MVEQMEMTLEQIKEHHSIFPDPAEDDRLCVRIEMGPFAGLGVAYGKLQMSDEENDDGTTKVRYEYDMIDIPPDMKDKEFTDEEGEMLERVLGQIYIHILNEQLEQQKEMNKDGTTRNYHFTKPTL